MKNQRSDGPVSRYSVDVDSPCIVSAGLDTDSDGPFGVIDSYLVDRGCGDFGRYRLRELRGKVRYISLTTA